MPWYPRLFSARPSPEAVSRRRFVAAAGVAAGSLLLADAAEAHAPVPGTLADARGRPLDRPARGHMPYLGEIQAVAFNFRPTGWALCNGQLLSIDQYQDLFSILGTTYGGDGHVNFALPDFRGRVPIHSGNGSAGPGLSSYALGTSGGTETVTLPPHTHQVPVVQVRGTGTQVTGLTTGGVVGTTATGSTGNGGAQSNLQPYLVLTYIIAITGTFPPQS